MKNLVKKSLVLVAFVASAYTYGSDASFSSKPNEKTTTVTLKSVEKGNKLIIKDVHGTTLYKETIQHTGNYAKGFDLTTLPNGDYFFEVDKGLQISVIPFSVDFEKVSFNKESENVIHKPFVRTKNNAVYVTKLSLQKSPLTIKVYYEDKFSYELIHTEDIEDAVTLEKVFRLDENEKGNYKIVIEDEGRTFTNYLKV